MLRSSPRQVSTRNSKADQKSVVEDVSIDNDDTTTLSSRSSRRLEKMQQEWTVLEQEYDVAAPARSAAGHLKRKVPKAQWKERTQKRRMLEKSDEKDLEHQQDQVPRLRGSKVAFDEQLIEGSLIFPRPRMAVNEIQSVEREVDAEHETSPAAMGNAMEDEDEDEEYMEDEESEEEGESEAEDADDAEEEEGDVENENEAMDDDLQEKNDFSRVKSKKRKVAKTRPVVTNRRRLMRLRNFTSQRLAHRHGEALAAHARGQPKHAIELLKNLAKDVPSAPQIYSSLGMIYEDMLKESRRKQIAAQGSTAGNGKASQLHTNNVKSIDAKEDSIPDPYLAEQLDFAQKTYGSFHIAAILRKKDHMLWVRAADMGYEVANILEQASALPNLDAKVVAYHYSERKRWLSEVLRDLRAADNLKPPGIDVPCKLAAVNMEMGSLSEALTILTDLKNQKHPSGRGRGEFQSSYKTWKLYADLMLRVGHECMQWNRGIRKNDNFMFRRWLRKFSEVFDWQERRLQALSLALEAAAGTKSTQGFLAWIKERALNKHSETKKNVGVDIVGTAAAAAEREADTDDTSTSQLAFEKQMMLAKHKSEIDAFDKSTNDMDLSSNTAAIEDRKNGRKALLKTHAEAAAALDNEYSVNNNTSTTASDEDEMVTDFQDFLPISASCQQVCKIASELIKHLHGLELYVGARLVGESVSRYLKERVEIRDKRVAAAKRKTEWQDKMATVSFLFESYEVDSEDEVSEEGDSSPYLSDDEDLDNEDNSQLVDSLRKGMLPPELRVLYGLALIGEGGWNFLAGNCLRAIDDLGQETSDWLTLGEPETNASADPYWYLFKRAMTEPLGRTSAYAFLADVLRKSKKETEWSVHFAPWFRRQLGTLITVGLKERLMGLRGEASPFVNFRKNQLLKIIVAASRFDVDAVECPVQKSPVNREVVVTNDSERASIAIAVLKSISEILYLMWSVEKDGSVSSICSEAIKISSRCLQWLAREAQTRLSYHTLHTVLSYSNTILSFFCGNYAELPDFKIDEEVAGLMDQSWGHFPVKADWLAPEYRHVALRIYNLTVACNVSLFSGWESDEFTFQLLRRRHGHRHFGVHLRDRRLTGFLPEAMEKEIGKQWETFRTVLPSFPDLRFYQRLREVKESDWYKSEVADREKTLDGSEIARYQEESAELLFLAYSALCLRLASSEENPKVKNRLLHASLSILLPVSQFCVDDRLWESDIGEAAGTLSSFHEWKLFNRIGVEASIDRIEKKRKRWRRSAKVVEKKLQEWIKGTKKPTLQSFVSLPLSEMRREWFHYEKEPSENVKNAVRLPMEKVHVATKKLRACYTEAASEKASLQVSVALLELASLPGCYDPFRCLQQAAMFASQACKAGNSDMAYREKLPPREECTPLQALVILGRADCLHSVFFPNEAAFLCSYVALVCSMHRENDDPENIKLEWNDRWKIVAIYAYNVSVMIRTTVSTVLDKERQKSFLSMWERDVVEELERGRADGWVWKRNISNHGCSFQTTSGTAPESYELEDFDADEAENGLDDQGNDSEDDSEEEGEDDDDEGKADDDEEFEDKGVKDEKNDDNDFHDPNILDEKSAEGEDSVPMAMEDPDLAMDSFQGDMPFPNIDVPDFLAAAPSRPRDEDGDDKQAFEGITMVSV